MNPSKHRHVYSWSISIVCLIVILAFSYGADIVLSYLRHRNISTFNLGTTIFVTRAFLILLLAIGLLLLSWFILIRTPSSSWVAISYLLVGLLILSFPLLWFAGFLYNSIPLPVGRYFADFLLTDPIFTFYTGGFTSVIGLLGIIRSSKEKRIPQ